MTTITIERTILDRLIEAWDSTVLPTHRDGMMQEHMEDLRAELAKPVESTAPIRAYRLTLQLDADTLSDMVGDLTNLSLRADRGELTRGVYGGPDSGCIYELLYNPEQTHETYFNQVREYLERKKL